jgi:hypothetical protein
MRINPMLRCANNTGSTKTTGGQEIGPARLNEEMPKTKEKDSQEKPQPG